MTRTDKRGPIRARSSIQRADIELIELHPILRSYFAFSVERIAQQAGSSPPRRSTQQGIFFVRPQDVR